MDDGSVDVKHIIDKGEALLAVTGIRRVIDASSQEVPTEQVKESRAMAKTIRGLAKSLVMGEVPPPGKVGSKSYKRLLDELTQSIDVDAMHDQVRSGDLALAWVTAATRGYAFLQSALPKNLYNTQVSTMNLDVNDVDLWNFEELLDLIDQPLRLFNMIATGEIRLSQVQAVRMVYPTLCLCVDESIVDAITDQLVKDKEFELPVSVEFGVATWRGSPITSVPWQSAYAVPAAVRQPSPSAAKSPLAAEAASSTEASLYKAAGLKP